jgi:hypothetical protein
MTSTSKAACEYIEKILFGQADLAKPEKGGKLISRRDAEGAEREIYWGSKTKH